MQHVDSLGKPDRINGAKSIAGVILDDLKNAWTLPPPWLGRGMLAGKLRHAERGPETILNDLGKGQ